MKLSASQIAKYAVCQYAWYLDYVEKVPRGPVPMIPMTGIILHNYLEVATVCAMGHDRWVDIPVEEVVERLKKAADECGEYLPDPVKDAKMILSHVDTWRGAFLPKLQPVAVEKWYSKTYTMDDGEEIEFNCRVDMEDRRGFLVDHKLKNKVCRTRETVPAADLMEMVLHAATAGVRSAALQVYGRNGKDCVVVPLFLTTGSAPLFQDTEAMDAFAGNVIFAVAQGIRAGNCAPTGLYTERWGKSACYYCDHRKNKTCYYAREV